MKKYIIIIAIILILLMRKEIEQVIVSGNYLSIDDAMKIINQIKTLNPKYAKIPNTLILAFISTESNFNINATGDAGEYGLMQILPSTFDWVQKTFNIIFPQWINTNPYDVYNNISTGMAYISYLYDNLQDDILSVIHAYNEGLGNYTKGKRVYSYAFNVLSQYGKYQIIYGGN